MERKLSRRDALKRGTAIIGMDIVGASTATGLEKACAAPARQKMEWKNRQPGIGYKRLGRTGYMLSRIVMGGNTIAPDNNKHVEMAVEMGLNYFDTSPHYGRGNSEKGYGVLLKSSSMRDKVFVNTKISIFDSNRNDYYGEMYKGLDSAEKNKIDSEIDEIMDRRGVWETLYMGKYGSWQKRELRRAYISNIMEKYYGDKIDRRKEYYDRIIKSVEESLTRLNINYLDLFMCPHGANSPEELLIPEMREAMEKLKRDGKVRAFGFSCHSDPAGVLLTAFEDNFYDACMIAFSITNGDFVKPVLARAFEKDIGVIAMKAAKPIYPDREGSWIPASRVEKLHHVVPGDMKVPMKAYLWALHNPNLTACVSDMKNADHVRDNLPLADMKVELNPVEDTSGFTF